MFDDVYAPDYWDKAGKTTNYYAILSADKYRVPDVFWACAPDVEVMLALKPTDVFLDVGCGFGRVAFHVAGKVAKCYSVDYSNEMILRAREFSKKSSNEFTKNNGKDLVEFSNDKFDIVHTTLMFQHVSKLTIFDYLREFARVMKKDGKVFAYGIPRDDKYANGVTLNEVETLCNKLFKKSTVITTPAYYTVLAEGKK